MVYLNSESSVCFLEAVTAGVVFGLVWCWCFSFIFRWGLLGTPVFGLGHCAAHRFVSVLPIGLRPIRVTLLQYGKCLVPWVRVSVVSSVL